MSQRLQVVHIEEKSGKILEKMISNRSFTAVLTVFQVPGHTCEKRLNVSAALNEG